VPVRDTQTSRHTDSETNSAENNGPSGLQSGQKVISSYLFDVFRAIVRSVEWSGVSGVDSPGSVQGPPTASTFPAVRVVRERPLPGAR